MDFELYRRQVVARTPAMTTAGMLECAALGLLSHVGMLAEKERAALFENHPTARLTAIDDISAICWYSALALTAVQTIEPSRKVVIGKYYPSPFNNGIDIGLLASSVNRDVIDLFEIARVVRLGVPVRLHPHQASIEYFDRLRCVAAGFGWTNLQQCANYRLQKQAENTHASSD